MGLTFQNQFLVPYVQREMHVAGRKRITWKTLSHGQADESEIIQNGSKEKTKTKTKTHTQDTALLNVENTLFSPNMLHLYEVVPRMSKTFQPFVNKLWLKATQDTIDTL